MSRGIASEWSRKKLATRLPRCTVAPAFKTPLLIALLELRKSSGRKGGGFPLPACPWFCPFRHHLLMQPPAQSPEFSSLPTPNRIARSARFPPSCSASFEFCTFFCLRMDKSHTAHSFLLSLCLCVSIFSVCSNPCKGQTADFYSTSAFLPLATMQFPLGNRQKASQRYTFYSLICGIGFLSRNSTLCARLEFRITMDKK